MKKQIEKNRKNLRNSSQSVIVPADIELLIVLCPIYNIINPYCAVTSMVGSVLMLFSHTS